MATTTRAPARTRLRRRLGGAVAVAALVGGIAGAAHGLPPDGPGPETPGTSSRVWPTTLQAGATLNFTVSGFPANETVYIKIDDGVMCTDTSHGACVYHTEALDSTGSATGSLVLPASLAPGAHWLRMLATGDVFDPTTGEKIGYEGYTRRGGNDFTIVVASDGGGTSGGGSGAGTTPSGAQTPADGGGSTDDGGSGDGGAAATTSPAGAGAVGADGEVEGGSIAVDVGGDEATATTEAATDTTAADRGEVVGGDDEQAVEGLPAGAVRAVAPAAGDTDDGVPTTGIAVVGAAAVAGAAMLGLSWRRRSRLVAAARSAGAAATDAEGASGPSSEA